MEERHSSKNAAPIGIDLSKLSPQELEEFIDPAEQFIPSFGDHDRSCESDDSSSADDWQFGGQSHFSPEGLTAPAIQ